MPDQRVVPRLIAADPASELGQRALRSYWADIVGRYWRRPATNVDVEAAMREYPSDDLVPPDGLLVVAAAEGVPVGCGGIRFLPEGVAEVTRVHVAPQERGCGLGSRIVQYLERQAFDHERTRIRLDVRTDLVEARAMYARLGYLEVPRFNDHPYVGHWFEKHL